MDRIKKVISQVRSLFGKPEKGKKSMHRTKTIFASPVQACSTQPTTKTKAGTDDTPIAASTTSPLVDFGPQCLPTFSWPSRRDKRGQSPTRKSSDRAESLDPFLLAPGITGVDFNLPLFDGTSDDPADHIIDLDTDSMERCADVRVYFWYLGDMVQDTHRYKSGEAIIERPTDPLLRSEYDERSVKMGREYLQESRDKKEGYYLSCERDHLDEYLKSNHPGRPWFRLPTIGLGSLFDGDGTNMVLSDIVKTNIRVPMIWVETLKEPIVQGTHGWDIPIMSAYSYHVHPAFRVLDDTVSDFEVVSHVLLCPLSPQPREPCNSVITCQVLARDFAHFKAAEEADEKQDEMDPEEKAGLRAKVMECMSSWEDFMYGKPEFHRRKTVWTR